MEPRDRVLAAIERRPGDRVPMRMNARREVLDSLRAYLQLDSDDEILRRLGIDFRYVAPQYAGPRPRKGYLPESAPPRPDKQSGVSTSGVSNNFRVYAPFANMQDASDLDGYEAHLMQDLECQDPSRMAEAVERTNARERYFVGYKSAGRIFMAGQELRGAEQLLMDMALNPEFAHRLFEIRTGYTVALLEQVMQAAGDRLDVVQYNDDLGTQQSLMVSPEMFREFLLPRYRRMFSVPLRYGVPVFMHCCGAIRSVIPDLIDAGVSILNPVQVGAVGMEPAGLKRDFGERLTFCGGIDVQSTLPFGTPEDVRQEVVDRVAVLGKGGGYILDSTNFIQPDTSPENVVAMFEAGRGEHSG